MKFSFSHSKIFKHCQRQWYLGQYVADGRAKHPLRHEAFLLKKLDNLWSWRGKLIDTVISKYVVQTIERRQRLDLTTALQYAKNLYDAQLISALKHQLREPNISISDLGDSFAAFRDVEYGTNPTDENLTKAWDDIELALNNFLSMTDLITLLSKSSQLMAQRTLQYNYDFFGKEPVAIIARPDLIAFFTDRPPLIVDWKAHTFGGTDYRLQLALYAYTLSNCVAHKDFPSNLNTYTPIDFDLLEVQLLTNKQRPYKLNQEDIDNLLDYITETAISMELALGEEVKDQFDPFEFPATLHPNICSRCNFKSICWKEPSCVSPKQIPLAF